MDVFLRLRVWASKYANNYERWRSYFSVASIARLFTTSPLSVIVRQQLVNPFSPFDSLILAVTKGE